MMNRLKHHYNTVIIQDLIENFEYSDVLVTSTFRKNHFKLWFKYNNFNTKQIGPILVALESLTGQRPTITRSVKDNASLKVRSGMITGVKVTLRKDKMYDVLRTI